MALDLSKYKIENGVISLPLEDLRQLLIYVEEAKEAHTRVGELESEIAHSEIEHLGSNIPAEIRAKLDSGESPVRTIRTWRGLSQKTLSAQSGISPSMLSEIENGVKTGSIDTLKKLASTLDVGLEILVS
jgi:ribosome-binding protein aMBF1 (putative translation factor)